MLLISLIRMTPPFWMPDRRGHTGDLVEKRTDRWHTVSIESKLEGVGQPTPAAPGSPFRASPLHVGTAA
jgi:hypothetical protein